MIIRCSDGYFEFIVEIDTLENQKIFSIAISKFYSV
jgi:hypothetical protein